MGWQRVARRVVGAVVLTVVGAGTVPAAGASGPPTPGDRSGAALARAANAFDDAAPTAVDTSSCHIIDVLTSMTGAGADRVVTLRTAPTSFRIGAVPTSWWARPPVTTPVWLMYFQGLIWTGEVARDAVATGDTAAVDALVRTAAASVAANPDPGTSVRGWDEGTNLRRQQALNCLYRVSGGDPRLVPAIEATAAANIDPTRYYGLPRKGPHNHGAMANLALLDAGTLLDRPEWRRIAVYRLTRDGGSVWTPQGFSVEQSAGYMQENIALWDAAADAIAANPDPTIAAQAAGIRAGTARARVALAHLVTPAGDLVRIGDGNPSRPGLPPAPTTTIRDDAAGILAGRWSWTDPATSYYLLRYGPPRQQHGHQDRTALVWSTDGVPVLVDPGTYTNDPNPFGVWGRSPAAHSVQVPVGRTLDLAAPVTLVAASRSATDAGMTTRDSQYGLLHTRNWRVDAARHTVTLTDAVAARATTTLTLDPTWTLRLASADRRTLVLRSPSGHQLTVRGSAPMRLVRGSSRPLLGWAFPEYGRVVPAPQVLMDAPAGRSSVVLTVTSPRPSVPERPAPTRP